MFCCEHFNTRTTILSQHVEQYSSCPIPSNTATLLHARGTRIKTLLDTAKSECCIKLSALLDKSTRAHLMRKRQNHTDTGTRLLMRFSELAAGIFTVTGYQPNTKTKEGNRIHRVWPIRDQRRCSILFFAAPCISSWWYKLHHVPGARHARGKGACLPAGEITGCLKLKDLWSTLPRQRELWIYACRCIVPGAIVQIMTLWP